MRLQHMSRKLVVLVAWLVLACGLSQAQVQGVSDTEIVIGTTLDLSGPIASMGAPIRDGMLFAVQDINAAGGIHGRKIRLVVEDNGYDPRKAVLATEKMLTRDKVFAIVGVLGSPTALAAMPLAIDRGIPFLFAGAASDSTWTPLHPLKFGLTTPYGDAGRAMVRFAHDKLGKRRFGILYQDDDNGQSLLKAAEAQLKVHGLSPIEVVSYKRGQIDFSAQIARLRAANVDAVMLGTAGPRDTASAAIETQRQGWRVDLLAGLGASTADTLKLGGPAVEGLYATFQFLLSNQEMTPPLRAAWDRFKAQFGHEPHDTEGVGYNAIMLFAEGAKNAGRDLTPQTLSGGLEKVRNFTTVFEGPPVSYGPGEHGAPRSSIIMQIRGGRFVRVASQ